MPLDEIKAGRARQRTKAKAQRREGRELAHARLSLAIKQLIAEETEPWFTVEQQQAYESELRRLKQRTIGKVNHSGRDNWLDNFGPEEYDDLRAMGYGYAVDEAERRRRFGP